jgi:hypothetical protein
LRQPFGQPVPIGNMEREGLLQNPKKSFCLCRVLVGSLQRRYGLTLTVDAVLSALNAQLGILYEMIQCRAGHAEARHPAYLREVRRRTVLAAGAAFFRVRILTVGAS